MPIDQPAQAQAVLVFRQQRQAPVRRQRLLRSSQLEIEHRLAYDPHHAVLGGWGFTSHMSILLTETLMPRWRSYFLAFLSLRAFGHKRRYKATTDSKHTLPVADNLPKRHFTPTAPNEVWTADMTYLRTD